MKNTKITVHKELDDILLDFRRIMTSSLLKESHGSGFSLSHFEIIKYVAEKGRVSMKDIATWLHITPPSASALVDVLVKKKLVTRIPSEKDRRTIHIILNKEAHKLLFKIHKNKITAFKKMLSKLDSKDKEDLVRIISKCISN